MIQKESPDVAVIGAGPAGIAAALRTQESGARGIVFDDNSSPGGQIWRGTETNRWLRRFRAIEKCAITNCRVIAAQASPLKLLVETANGAREIYPRKLIIATGARELFVPFPGWTLPGVMGVGGLQALAKSGLPVAGKKVVIAGSGPLLLAVASYLRTHGADVKCIAEQTPRRALVRFALRLVREPGKLAQAASMQFDLRGIPYIQDCWIEEARGDGRLQQVRLRRPGKTWTEECDYAGVAYGLVPNTELASLLGCDVSSKGVTVDHMQRSSVDDVFCAGECTGIGGVDLSIVEGEIAGYAAAGQLDRASSLSGAHSRARRFADLLNRTFALRKELKALPRPDTFVCRCEDVIYARLQRTRSFREAKLHTRCGMGPCQGRVCGPAAEFLFGWSAESIRPPIFPARLGTLADATQEKQEISTAQ